MSTSRWPVRAQISSMSPAEQFGSRTDVAGQRGVVERLQVVPAVPGQRASQQDEDGTVVDEPVQEHDGRPVGAPGGQRGGPCGGGCGGGQGSGCGSWAGVACRSGRCSGCRSRCRCRPRSCSRPRCRSGCGVPLAGDAGGIQKGVPREHHQFERRRPQQGRGQPGGRHPDGRQPGGARAQPAQQEGKEGQDRGLRGLGGMRGPHGRPPAPAPGEERLAAPSALMGRHLGGPGRPVAVRDSPPAVSSGPPSVTGGQAGDEPYHRAVRLTARWYGDLVAAPRRPVPHGMTAACCGNGAR